MTTQNEAANKLGDKASHISAPVSKMAPKPAVRQLADWGGWPPTRHSRRIRTGATRKKRVTLPCTEAYQATEWARAANYRDILSLCSPGGRYIFRRTLFSSIRHGIVYGVVAAPPVRFTLTGRVRARCLIRGMYLPVTVALSFEKRNPLLAIIYFLTIRKLVLLHDSKNLITAPCLMYLSQRFCTVTWSY